MKHIKSYTNSETFNMLKTSPSVRAYSLSIHYVQVYLYHHVHTHIRIYANLNVPGQREILGTRGTESLV